MPRLFTRFEQKVLDTSLDFGKPTQSESDLKSKIRHLGLVDWVNYLIDSELTESSTIPSARSSANRSPADDLSAQLNEQWNIAIGAEGPPSTPRAQTRQSTRSTRSKKKPAKLLYNKDKPLPPLPEESDQSSRGGLDQLELNWDGPLADKNFLLSGTDLQARRRASVILSNLASSTDAPLSERSRKALSIISDALDKDDWAGFWDDTMFLKTELTDSGARSTMKDKEQRYSVATTAMSVYSQDSMDHDLQGGEKYKYKAPADAPPVPEIPKVYRDQVTNGSGNPREVKDSKPKGERPSSGKGPSSLSRGLTMKNPSGTSDGSSSKSSASKDAESNSRALSRSKSSSSRIEPPPDKPSRSKTIPDIKAPTPLRPNAVPTFLTKESSGRDSTSNRWV
ncbi:hypothetical protein CC1G_02702 [Coprinopsis cinerea okayama7|uniref:Uncharacterized protein n=1 Tax=Coprinopsis cinerea (strain Okayama-7 / 130 / ATCC MYA-4618 / FGSC 9003) TaxID=240176 RepID=A8PBQ0_COPC7|nr:hypothetical protein CC1G_02702 [Coprinopsis cinerea okayama7\|eukprot:XP_001840239.2 hypothetical protein CC1G_02702 [Coprinopsis cinerea okayama7\